jgi:ketosteroid isomerase-like protein
MIAIGPRTKSDGYSTAAATSQPKKQSWRRRIKRLKAVYCMYCDAKYDAAGICSLFTEDGVWDGGPSFGRYQGHDQIRNFFEGISGHFGKGLRPFDLSAAA